MFKLPAHDDHFAEFAEKGNYQRTPLLAAMKRCTRFEHAVDIGAHCGFMTAAMQEYFAKVTCFEPCPANYACLEANIRGATLHNVAVGAENKRIYMQNPHQGNSGAWIVTDEPTDVVVKMRTLDSFQLEPDFIKIDIQGYELAALQGGYNTIRKYRPHILVEIMPTPDNAVHRFLSRELDMAPYSVVGKDWLYVPNIYA